MSKGCGALAGAAPIGLTNYGDPFFFGSSVAALTHGHPTGYLAAGFLSELIHALLTGETLETAIAVAIARLRREPDHEQCLQSVMRALERARLLPGTPESVERFGRGWGADKALAIALFCALKAESFEQGIILAVNHSGVSAATGTITGNILGALFGESSIPHRWLELLELRAEIREVACDLFRHYTGLVHDGWSTTDWDKYPGW